MAKRHLVTKIKLILASKSPRRRELLSNLGLTFECVDPNIEELRRKNESPRKYVRRNALEKAQVVLQDFENQNVVVLAADTIVVIGKKVLEKPRTIAEAKSMLKCLSGQTHKVLTGVSIKTNNLKIPVKNFTVQTLVTFKKLSASEIANYVATKEPMDKAGAYAAQGKGAFMVKSVRGSYTNVIGLPMGEVADILTKQFKLQLFKKKQYDQV